MPYNKFYVSKGDVTNPDQLQRTFNTVQQNVDAAVTRIEKVSLLNGVQFDDVAINTTHTLLHKLGRTPLGYIVVRNTANSTVWDSGLTDISISLHSSASTTISIYVY